MKLFTKSVDFAAETYPRIPERIQRLLSKEKWMKFLRIFGIVFVVLPEKNLGRMEQYIYAHTGMPPQICRLLAFIFIWCYPAIIILLLVSFYPLSCAIAISQNIRNPSIWIETIWNTDIFIARFFLGALLTTIFLRIIFEIFQLLTTLALILDILSMVKFTFSWIAYLMVYPMYLVLRLFAWISDEPILMLGDILKYPVTGTFYIMQKIFKYLFTFFKNISDWLISGYGLFMEFFLNYYIYIILLVFALYMYAIMTGHGRKIGLLLSTKQTKKVDEKLNENSEKLSNESEECSIEQSDSHEKSSNKNEKQFSSEEEASEIYNLRFDESNDWSSSISTLDFEEINKIIKKMSVDEYYRNVFLEQLRISQRTFLHVGHNPESDAQQAPD